MAGNQQTADNKSTIIMFSFFSLRQCPQAPPITAKREKQRIWGTKNGLFLAIQRNSKRRLDMIFSGIYV
jgi:hypothetical protein